MKKTKELIICIVLTVGLVIALCSSSSVGSNDVTMDMSVLQKTDTTVYDVVDEYPSFPGGNSAMMSYLSKNIKMPTEWDVIPSSVIVRFIVERDGSLTNINVKAADARVVKEIHRVIKEMPKWTPGKLHGKAVRGRYTIPLTICFLQSL